MKASVYKRIANINYIAAHVSALVPFVLSLIDPWLFLFGLIAPLILLPSYIIFLRMELKAEGREWFGSFQEMINETRAKNMIELELLESKWRNVNER